MSDPNDFDYVVVGGRSAGNAVVFKPSEHTPGTGAWLVDTFAQVVPEQPVLQLVTGPGATGQALCRAGLDKIAFTSSAATRKQVMRACADGLVPVVIEGGGKDALLADADIPAAADAAVWGGMSNAGQSCVGVERVYVHAQVRRVPRRGHHPGQGPAGRPRAEDRPDDHPGAAPPCPRAATENENRPAYAPRREVLDRRSVRQAGK